LRAARRRAVVAWSRVLDLHFDVVFGTDTRAKVENVDLTDVASANLARGIRYEPTRAIPFRRVLRAARIPVRGTFVDLGCGKGRVCMLAALHGFPHVVGIDYSPGLCRIAERNLERLRARTGRNFDVDIRVTDATQYAFAPDDSVVYLFNPFDEAVLTAVLERLRASLRVHPRPVWLVYHNPMHRGAIEATREYDFAGTWTFGGCRFVVYRSR
jgi:SAM-dependent methyltransferase